ncbi:hypothetical protein N7495_009918 [Penicillium taxi]|uniref:uncharacterized protein n=1 Tax=Penicillium taxi TaxID=168475 RepID=UPI0025451B44|nr:uncharacterized protein N7495_009918 [Penicillium taxi]KAJ5885408.1 hypothetical protein N7495_009918 [Penicillium taxi]
MAFNRSSTLSNLSIEDERYLSQLSPQSRPMDMFQKGSDPLPGNWNYDSAIDLFSLNPVDMDPVSFDFADTLTSTDSKDIFMDPFETPTAISGFSMPTAEDNVSLSSPRGLRIGADMSKKDFDSDDQSWPHRSIDITPKAEPTNNKSSKPVTRNSVQSTTSSSRWSSSPEMKPQEYTPRADKSVTSTNSRKTRSYSQDSNRSSTSQDPQMRNAAKRAAHNIIEKRYRTNMNAKFLALEKAISPAGVQKQSSRAGAGSLKKSEILTNALAYIESVQQENSSLHKELALLKQNMIPGMWRHSKQPRA